MDPIATAYNAGLSAPSGQLFANWFLIDQTKKASHGGAATAVNATFVDPVTNLPVNGHGNIMFAPQRGIDTGMGFNGVSLYTADPLLRGVIPALWYDLPDMSTPILNAGLTGNATDPLIQAAVLSDALGRTAVLNEYWTSVPGVVMNTDWVISQPTRRYFAAVAYGPTPAAAAIVWNAQVLAGMAPAALPAITTVNPNVINNRYGSLFLKEHISGMGQYACVNGGLFTSDTEEGFPGAEKSPGRPLTWCGEVAVVQFGSGVLGAKVTPTTVDPKIIVGQTGWGQLNLSTAAGALPLPLVGYAATMMSNGSNIGNFAGVLPHRW
jgi:hypothetical protein